MNYSYSPYLKFNMEAYRSGHNGADSKSCDPFIKTAYFYTEWYRSGRNELDSKSSCPQGHVGSNPTASAMSEQDLYRLLRLFLPKSPTCLFLSVFFLEKDYTTPLLLFNHRRHIFRITYFTFSA